MPPDVELASVTASASLMNTLPAPPEAVVERLFTLVLQL